MVTIISRLCWGLFFMPRKYVKFVPMPEFSNSEKNKFLSHIIKKEDCWSWDSTTRFGYGKFRIKDKEYMAHRVSYYLNFGIDPKDLFVCHKCDNRICVKPEHLFLGSNRDNMQDALLKGRMFLGEKNSFSKLKVVDIHKIRNLYSLGNSSYEDIAISFGVSNECIRKVIKRFTWANV